jgi:hypothetical protein
MSRAAGFCLLLRTSPSAARSANGRLASTTEAGSASLSRDNRYRSPRLSARTRASAPAACSPCRDQAARRGLRIGAALRPLGRIHDALDHHGRDAREHGFGHRGFQDVDDWT